MRFLAVAGLLVVALGVGLWLLVMRDDDAKVVPDAKASPAKRDEAAPVASVPRGEMAPRRVENMGAEIQKSIVKRPTAGDPAAPSLSVEGAGSGSAKVPTPEDHMRWSMMRAVHSLEPAIIDCLDGAKKNGETFGDAIASYGFFFTKNGDDIVLDDTSLEYGPFSDSVNNCIKAAGKSMAIEQMPPGAKRIKVFSKITLEKGEIKNLQMPSFHVLESN